MLLFGCGKADPDKAQLQKEIDRLRQAKSEAEAEKLVLQREIAAYRADLEHERFRNQELKHKVKELKGLEQIVEIAKGLPKTESAGKTPAARPESPTERPQPAPISAAIAVARAVPDAEPTAAPKPEPVAHPAKPSPAKPISETKRPAPKPGPEPKTAAAKPPETKPAVKSKPAVAEKPEAVKGPAVARKTEPPPTVAAASTPPKPTTSSAAPPASAPASPAEELQLLNLVNRREGKRLLLSGEVRNNTALPAQKVIVTCRLYDEFSRTVREIRIPIDGGSLIAAGATRGFRAETPWDERVSGCRFEVEGVQRVDVSRRN